MILVHFLQGMKEKLRLLVGVRKGTWGEQMAGILSHVELLQFFAPVHIHSIHFTQKKL